MFHNTCMFHIANPLSFILLFKSQHCMKGQNGITVFVFLFCQVLNIFLFFTFH